MAVANKGELVVVVVAEGGGGLRSWSGLAAERSSELFLWGRAVGLGVIGNRLCPHPGSADVFAVSCQEFTRGGERMGVSL